MQKSVPILRTDRNKFSKMSDTKTKIKNITADSGHLQHDTDDKTAQVVTSVCRHAGFISEDSL